MRGQPWREPGWPRKGGALLSPGLARLRLNFLTVAVRHVDDRFDKRFDARACYLSLVGTRGDNLRRVFDLVRAHGTLTRSQVAERAGLSRSAVSSLVGELIEIRWLLEREGVAKGPGSGSGRPALVLAPVLPEGLLLGMDFGHNHVRVAVANMACEVQAERTTELDVDGHAQEALDCCSDLVADVLGQVGATTADVQAAAAGIPGPLDNAPERKVRSPTILAGWIDLSPAAELQRRIGHPVAVDNDANLGALGELRFGAGRDIGDFIYIKASHGVGASYVLDGRLYRGSTGIAGEIGHTQIPGAAHWCRCGSRGCLETAISIEIVRAELRRLRPDGDIPGQTPDDPVARRILAEAGRIIGRVAADLCNFLNPAALIIGGELAEYGNPVIGGVRDSIDRHAQQATSEAVTVLAGRHGHHAETLGALALAAQLTGYHA